MLLATLTYWLAKKKLIDIPPKDTGLLKEKLHHLWPTVRHGLTFQCLKTIPTKIVTLLKKVFRNEGVRVIIRLFVFLYIYVAVFWSLFNQTMSKWVLQAQKMDLRFFNWSFAPENGLGKLLSIVHLDTVQWNILPEQLQGSQLAVGGHGHSAVYLCDLPLD